MEDFSILIGGKAGFGIDHSSLIIGDYLSKLGYNIYIYRDYPSLIRGGHTFSIIRASKKQKIAAHKDRVEIILALNQECVDLHKARLQGSSCVIYDSNVVKAEGLAIPATQIVQEEKGSDIMRNSCLIGACGKILGLEWKTIEEVFGKRFTNEKEINLKIALQGYNSAATTFQKIEKSELEQKPLFSGNETLSLGLIKGGLDSYIAYPMTPSSGILHFMAKIGDSLNLKVMHPESEIGVMLMALGFAYTGSRVATGTSGGGFCLMTEGLSFAGMAELPIAIIVGQRTGPSTGLPTYTAQTDLNFILNAGHGEFSRFVVAPGDAEEAYYWSAIALNLAWKYQIPALIVTDKTLAEGTYSFDVNSVKNIPECSPIMWDNKGTYRRYVKNNNDISPLAFAPLQNQTIKINSYEHDEDGITTEDPQTTQMMQEKRINKELALSQELLEKYSTITVSGNKNSPYSLLFWGSNKGVCNEVAEKLNLQTIQMQVFAPFPEKELSKIWPKNTKIICVENNYTGQLTNLLAQHGFKVDINIHKYDGRPFSVEELEGKIKEAMT